MTILIFLSVFIVSLISFVGALTLAIKQEKLETFTMFFVALSAGTLLGDAFLHLLPETMEKGGLSAWFLVLVGIIFFFVLEKFVHWRHCHVATSEAHPHPLGTMNFIGNGMHNLIDGIIIAGSYLVSIPLGITTTIAIVAHEIPQEISEFGVLIHAGYPRRKALFMNFLSAFTAVVGAIIAIIIGQQNIHLVEYIIPFAAGGFIYIASSDLIPELHKETVPAKSLKQLASILLGIGIMWLLKIYTQ